MLSSDRVAQPNRRGDDASVQDPQDAQTSALPKPVARYLALALGASLEAPQRVVLRQSGDLKTQPEASRWLASTPCTRSIQWCPRSSGTLGWPYGQASGFASSIHLSTAMVPVG